MAAALPHSGFLKVVSPAALNAAEAERDRAWAEARQPPEPAAIGLAAYIRTQYEYMRRHRNSGSGWSERLLAALRTFNGQYDPARLAQIRQFGGSDIYARVVAMKCRGASSLLRDVYLSADRPWDLEPPADPDVPPEVTDAIKGLVAAEVAAAGEGGVQVEPAEVRARATALFEQARQVAKKAAVSRTKVAEDRVEEMLQEGGFYRAFAEFLVDLPLFPFACLKGPVVRVRPSVVWENGRAAVKQIPRMTWYRVSPFDVYWTPGVSDIEDAAVIERQRLTRADLNDLLDLPGYDHAAIRAVLNDYGRAGLDDSWDSTDSERAQQENRESPRLNESGLISCLEFTGNIQGRMLLEQGMTEDEIPDPDRDYMVSAWLIGRHVIKAQLHPSPRRRHPYYLTSFEKVPGTPVGNGLPDILADMQDAANATLRALVNNLSIASGPQVVINDDRLAEGEDGEQLYPWKRWHMTRDPYGVGGSSAEKPVDFFQPASNAAELLGVYQKFSEMADELSAIPKYMSGSGATGGAGRTASGLAMLMGNASKILQTVAANVDRDVLEPLLQGLYDMVMLTDETGLFSGSETVRVKGVVVAVQRETQRARQLEFLQATANPLDSQITGLKGRATVLRAVADGLGLDGETIVPSDTDLERMEQEQQAAAQAQQEAAAQAQGMQQKSPVTGDMGPRTNLQQRTPTIAGGVG